MLVSQTLPLAIARGFSLAMRHCGVLGSLVVDVMTEMLVGMERDGMRTAPLPRVLEERRGRGKVEDKEGRYVVKC